MEQQNQANDNCTICGQSKTVAAGQSLTQWIFSAETCRCDVQFATNPNVCRFCGKTLTKGTFETMTQWIFHPDVCSCGVENQNFLASVQAATNSQQGSLRNATTNNTATLSPRAAFIYELENNEIDYHGLPVDNFPFERFRIIEEVGRGAGGVVYQAWDCILKRRVAIKTMHATAMSAEEVIRLQNEARTSSRLKHPAIIRILDFGAAPNGQPYLVSDFIDGITLESRLEATGPLSMAETLQMFTQLCAGIIHAHEQNVLHRDLKPSNVLISDDTGDGTSIQIIDFGVAGLKEALFQTSKVETSSLVGTPYYMSPEQAAGKAFDVRSEIYSIGIMMFEALTGQVPFRGETALTTLSLHAHEAVPELADINPDVDCSERLESIVFRCLEKDPNDRYQTVAELHNQLNGCLTQQSVETESPTYPRAEAKQEDNASRKTAIVAAVSAFVLLGLTALIWGVSTMMPETKNPATPMSSSKVTAKAPKLSKKDKFERDSNYTFFDGPLFTENKPWDNRTENDWVGSMWLKDEDFSRLKNERALDWVESPLSPDITGEGLKYIKGKPINILILNSAKLSDAALNAIGEMRTLKFLTIGTAHKLSANKFQVLKNLPLLATLKFQDVIHPPALLELLVDNKNFQALVLMDRPRGSGKTDWSPLTRMDGLKIFDVLKYDFTDADMKYIRSLTKLNELRLSDLGLTDFDAGKTIVAPLQILDLSFNKITDKTLETLGSIKTLKVLEVTGCTGVTANGINNLQAKLKHCTIITTNKHPRDEWSVVNINLRVYDLSNPKHKPD